METERQVTDRRSRVALVELTPEGARRLRDPRIVLAIVAVLLGAAAVFGGYLGISSTLDPGKQLPYLISGGVGGLFLLGVAAALFFSENVSNVRTDVQELADRVDDLASQLEQLHTSVRLLVEQQVEANGSSGRQRPEPGGRATTSTPAKRRSSTTT